MINNIYKHKFGGEAIIVEATIKLGRENIFKIELLSDDIVFDKIIEITEEDFHKEFKLHGFKFNFEEDDKSDSKDVSKFKLKSGNYDELEVSNLTDKVIKNYKVGSFNLTQIATDILSETNWSLGRVDKEFDLRYVLFEILNQNVLQAVYNLADIFNATVTIDKVSRRIDFTKPVEVDMEKYKWDYLLEDKNSTVSELLNKEWNALADKLEKGENTLVDTIYEIAKLAIRDNEKKTAEEFTKKIADSLKRQKGFI